MQKYSSTFIARACSLAVTLALVLSLAVVPASAVNASIKDMNPTDDPLLGTQFAVDAVIPLVSTGEGKDISVTIPVQGVSKDALSHGGMPSQSAHSRCQLILPLSLCDISLRPEGVFQRESPWQAG